MNRPDPQFGAEVRAGGYRWWYVDGVSDCRQFGLTVIAFVGSVFSPYYAWSGRKHPDNHIAFNVALYKPDGNAWAMTERGRKALSRDTNWIRIGPSQITMTDGGLTIAFDEISLPWPRQQMLPRRISGAIHLRTRSFQPNVFDLDQDGQHKWWPIAPAARIETDFSGGTCENWSGDGYFDSNWGSEGLEDRFHHWDWGCTQTGPDRSMVLYDIARLGSSTKTLCLEFSDQSSKLLPVDAVRTPLKKGYWGVDRTILCDDGQKPRTIRILEDSPFYVRSLVETDLFGRTHLFMHESYAGHRFRSPFVKLMLPFRMPRRI